MECLETENNVPHLPLDGEESLLPVGGLQLASLVPRHGHRQTLALQTIVGKPGVRNMLGWGGFDRAKLDMLVLIRIPFSFHVPAARNYYGD